MKLGIISRKMLKFIHVLLSGFWIGTILCILVLVTLDRVYASTIGQIYGCSIAMNRIITFITIPSVIGSYITGNIIAKASNWEKFLWVRVKRPLSAVIFLTACLYLRTNLSAMVTMTRLSSSMSLLDPIYLNEKRTIILLCVVQLIVTLFMFLISYLKPWMKKSNL